jgi:hypothetical protein
MIFFTTDNTDFAPGALFAIQAAAGLPPLPPGRAQVGTGYYLSASPNVSLPAGSISFQYLSNDVALAGADDTDLSLYFYDGATWKELPTAVDPTAYEAVAASQGPGLYALLASIEIPLPLRGWNSFSYPIRASHTVTDALASIAGKYALVYDFDNADTHDHWKVFAPSLPPSSGYVNDLQMMKFLQAYWISATMTTTVYLAPADVASGLLPPTTFYGTVAGSATFTPTDQMTVTAAVNGTVCGEGQTQAYGGQIVYTVDVDGNNGGGVPGCGQTGQSVTFYVDGQSMINTGTWDNSHLVPLDLAPAAGLEPRLYLPLLRR